MGQAVRSKIGEQIIKNLTFIYRFNREKELVKTFKGKDMEIRKLTQFQMIKMQLLEIPFHSPQMNIICINYILDVSINQMRNTSQCICIPTHHDVCFKYLIILFANYTSIKWGKKSFSFIQEWVLTYKGQVLQFLGQNLKRVEVNSIDSKAILNSRSF